MLGEAEVKIVEEFVGEDVVRGEVRGDVVEGKGLEN